MGADPIARLRAANPVPRAEIVRLSAELEARGGAASIPARLDNASATVEPPSRRMRGVRLVLVAVALVIAGLFVGSTLGLPVPALDFLRAKKAPDRVVKNFVSLTAGAPPGMDPGVIAGQARKVMTRDTSSGSHTLWVAPTKEGGFCYDWTAGTAGCEKLGTAPLSVTWSAKSFRLSKGQRFHRPRPEEFTSIIGFVHASYVDTVEIRFEDGETVRPSLVWVSPPIDAGFFSYDVPADHLKPGHGIASVAALDDEGEVVTQDAVAEHPTVEGVPADALADEKSAAVELETRQGTAVVWKAPTRYDGRCWWLEFEGENLPVAPCLPARYQVAPFAVRLLATKDDVLLVGVSSGFPMLEIRYADGDRSAVRIDNGVVLFAIPSQHLVRGHQATRLIARDAAGHATIDVPAEVGTSPCFGSVPLKREVSGPECLGG